MSAEAATAQLEARSNMGESSRKSGGPQDLEEGGARSVHGTPPVNKKLEVAQALGYTKREHYLAALTFTMIGSSQLLCWNLVINILVAFENEIWPGKRLTFLLGGCEHAGALAIAFLSLFWFRAINVTGLHIVGVANVVLYFVFPVIPQTLAGMENYTLAVVLMCLLMVMFGVGVGFFHIYGYAKAAACPVNYAVFVSIGNAVAGLVSFTVYIVFSEAVFEKNLKGQQKLTWVQFSAGGVLSIIEVVLFQILSRKPWFKEMIRMAGDNQEEVRSIVEEYGPPRSYWGVLKTCWLPVLNSGFALFTSLLVFPGCGPLGWGKSYTLTSLMNGTYQVLNFACRWLPQASNTGDVPLTIINVIGGLIIVPLFIIPARDVGIPFLSNSVWLFLLVAVMVIRMGWYITLGAVRCSWRTEHPLEKQMATNLFVVLIFPFITAALYACSLPLIGIS